MIVCVGRTSEGPNAAGVPVRPVVCPVDAPTSRASDGPGADVLRFPEPAREPVVGPLDAAARKVTAEARLDGVVVGTLTGRFPTPALFVADRIDVAAGAAGPGVRRAFARAATAALAPRDGECLVTEPGSPDGWRAAVESAGSVLRATKACVRRALDATLPTVAHSFVLRSLSEVGEDAFCARVELAATGDPFDARAGADRHRAWRDLVASAGDRFDPTSWFLVDDADGPVGVVLPQTLGADLGTLFYLGVEPGRRGRGLGAAVHGLGLWILAMRGLRRYVGSTDERNAPMLRVFARNGCPVTERDLHFGAPAASGLLHGREGLR